MTHVGQLHEARTDLAAIVRMADELPEEAVERGTTTSEAIHLLGKTADPDAWHQRIAHGWTPAPENADHQHPHWILADWDRTIRHHYGHDPRTVPPTLATLAGYIGLNLSDLAASAGFPFAELAQALRGCKAHLEQVLQAGHATERGAPCMTCHRPLARQLLTDPDAPWWECTTCGYELGPMEYRDLVEAAHLQHADRLTVADLAERIEVSRASLRKWASVVRIQAPGEQPRELSPLLRSCGRDSKGRKVYRVAEALRIRDAGGDTRKSSPA